MLLTISTTYHPATELGFLLYKHPQRAQTFDIASGKAHVFYPEASEQKCTAAMVLEMDPVKLVRGNRNARNEGWTLCGTHGQLKWHCRVPGTDSAPRSQAACRVPGGL